MSRETAQLGHAGKLPSRLSCGDLTVHRGTAQPRLGLAFRAPPITGLPKGIRNSLPGNGGLVERITSGPEE